MENIKNWKQFFESNESGVEISEEIKSAVKELVEKTIETNGGEFQSFVDKYVKDSEDVKILGLINDSDIFEFYLKWKNDIDPILNDIKFFDESPSKLGKLGLYQYVVSGTLKSVEEIVRGFL